MMKIALASGVVLTLVAVLLGCYAAEGIELDYRPRCQPWRGPNAARLFFRGFVSAQRLFFAIGRGIPKNGKFIRQDVPHRCSDR